MLVDGYVRVSQVRGRSRPQFISPSEPAGPIRDWAALHGDTVANVWEQLDESGARGPATAPALVSSEAILICNTVVEEPEGYLAPETHAEAAWAR